MRVYEFHLKYLGWIAAAGLALSVALAAFMRGGYERAFWTPSALIIALLLALFLMALNHRPGPAAFNPRADILLLLALGWAGLSFVGSVNREETLYQLLRAGTIVSAYFLAAYAVRDGARKTLLLAILCVCLFESLYGLYEFTSNKPLLTLSWIDLPFSDTEVRGTYLNHNHFAGLSEMGALLGLGVVMAMRGTSRRESFTQLFSRTAFFAIIPAIIALTLVLSLSRGGWISLLLGVGFFIILVLWKTRPALSKALVVFILAGAVAAGIMGGLNRDPLMKTLERLQEFYRQPEDLSLNTRILVWKSAADMAADRPLTGTGLGTFKDAYPAYRKGRILMGPAFAHNDYLQIAAECGVPAVLLSVAFIILVMKEGLFVIKKRIRSFEGWIMPGLLGALFAMLVHEAVDFNLMLPANALFFMIVAGTVSGMAAEARCENT